MSNPVSLAPESCTQPLEVGIKPRTFSSTVLYLTLRPPCSLNKQFFHLIQKAKMAARGNTYFQLYTKRCVLEKLKLTQIYNFQACEECVFIGEILVGSFGTVVLDKRETTSSQDMIVNSLYLKVEMGQTKVIIHNRSEIKIHVYNSKILIEQACATL